MHTRHFMRFNMLDAKKYRIHNKCLYNRFSAVLWHSLYFTFMQFYHVTILSINYQFSSPYNERYSTGVQEDFMDTGLSVDEIYQILEGEIVSLEIKPGEMLSENTLCKRFSISRTPVRSALQRLEQNRFVQIIPHKGTIVTPINLHIANQLIDHDGSEPAHVGGPVRDVLGHGHQRHEHRRDKKPEYIFQIYDRSLYQHRPRHHESRPARRGFRDRRRR